MEVRGAIRAIRGKGEGGRKKKGRRRWAGEGGGEKVVGRRWGGSRWGGGGEVGRRWGEYVVVRMWGGGGGVGGEVVVRW